MSAVRFSVVIPTRERADTLRYALRTCLDQTFDDYEIVVSDNCSSPATRAVVEEANSPKVRYVRTAEPVAMSTNWEFAVAHTRGEYVTVLGDDDGLLPYALTQLDGLLREHDVKAICWALAFYTWPSFRLAGHENYLRVPFGSALFERDGAKEIQQAADSLEWYEDLPMVYNAVVRRDVLDELRARAGKVFPHPSPDIYSGVAVAHAAGRFLSTSLPMSIRGLSGASTGIAALFDPGRTQIEREFRALNQKFGYRPDPRAPDMPILAACTADTIWLTERLFPELKVNVDRRKLTRLCVERVRTSEADWPAAKQVIRRSLLDDPDLVAWFDAELADTPYTPPQPITFFRPSQLGYDGTSLHLDAAEFGVTDVSGAARLCELILHYTGRAPITRIDDAVAVVRKITELTAPFDEEGANMVRRVLGWGQLIDRNRDLVAEREDLLAECARLHAVCAEREAIILRVDEQLRAVDAQLQEERRWSLKRPLRKVKRFLSELTRKLTAIRR